MNVRRVYEIADITYVTDIDLLKLQFLVKKYVTRFVNKNTSNTEPAINNHS
jgi:hypothetical protein